jgi:ATP-binding cassette, subfamily B, bacterial MsbA
MNVLHKIYQFIRPYRANLILSFILLFFLNLFDISSTFLAIPLFDQGLAPKQNTAALSIVSNRYLIDLMWRLLSMIPGSVIAQIAIAMIVLTFLKGVCLYYSNYSMNHVGQSVVTDLRTKLFGHVCNQSMAFFSLNSTGKLMSRMSNDVEQVQEAVSSSLGDFFREVVLLVGLFCAAFYIDWKLAFITILIVPLALLLTLAMGKRVRTVSVRGREDAATLNDQLQQSITGMRIIKAFGMEAHEGQRFLKNSVRLFRSNVKAAAILFLNSPVMEFLGVVAFIPLLYYAHLRIGGGSITTGMFCSQLLMLFKMYDPIRKLSRMHMQYQRAMASASRIVELFDAHMEIEDRPGARTLDGIRDSVEFRNVCFDYVDQNGKTQVLRDINLKVQRNQVIALVGSSGSGKTTLVGLIPRFHDPTAGAVLIDGIDIREYTQGSLRSQIAMVTQDTFLFNDTVRNNIAYGDIHASEEQIKEAAYSALADNFIKHFPAKYETLIGERGQRLSGGERQRLSIARALLRNAPILILDEATSALDSESEQLVQQALANLIKDRTTFVIAHRLSTIRNADIILVLDHGRIVESGSHDNLMEKNGAYRKFFYLQTEDSRQSAVGSR